MPQTATRLAIRSWSKSSTNAHGPPVDRAVGGIRHGPVHKEGENLHLLHVVESHKTDEGIGEGSRALLNLLEDTSGIGAAKHGQLPHSPVPIVVITSSNGAHTNAAFARNNGNFGVGKLQTRYPAVLDNVVNLLRKLVVGKGRQVGEGLKHPARDSTNVK